MRKMPLLYSTLAILQSIGMAQAGQGFLVGTTIVQDLKPIAATVESSHPATARVRTGGTIDAVLVHEGDRVSKDQVIAVVSDAKLQRQRDAIEQQIIGLKARAAQTQADLNRNHALFESGVTSSTDMDALKAAALVAGAELKTQEAAKASLQEQIDQGKVLAPSAGRILTIPVSAGMVVMAGETIATLSQANLVVRLEVPESSARWIKAGDSVTIEGAELPPQAIVSTVYPQIQDGQVEIDATTQGGQESFVGQRVRAWVPVGERRDIVVPATYLSSRYGLDFVHLKTADGAIIEAPVQRGEPSTLAEGSAGVEILSGLQSGDLLVQQ